MKIAVIITSINQTEHLPRALKSVSKQTRRPDKIVICSDQIVAEEVVSRHNAEVVYLSNGSDHTDAVIAGMMAVGNDCDIVTTLNAQDYYYANKIELSVAAMEKYPFVGIVYSDFDIHNVKENTVTGNKCHSYNESLLYGGIIPENCVIRNSLLQKYGKVNFTENDLMLRAKGEFVGYCLPTPTFCATLPREANAGN